MKSIDKFVIYSANIIYVINKLNKIIYIIHFKLI